MKNASIHIVLIYFLLLFSACASDVLGTDQNLRNKSENDTDSVSSSENESTDETVSENIFSNTDFAAIPPVDSDNFVLSSPFGPRLKANDDYHYDFHRGIDIPGDLGQDIYSISDGTLYKAYEEGSSSYPNGGNVVIIKYELKEPTTFLGETITELYAIYMHLDSFGEAAQSYLNKGEQAAISKGDIIGAMGQSGDTDFTHLHFEIRLQTTCSLEYQLENPDASCADYGFDPHVNPMALYIPESDPDDYTVSFSSASSSQANIKVTSKPETLNVDGIDFEIFADGFGLIKLYSNSLSFDTRAGFDATSTDSLDNSEIDRFTVDPERFNTSSEDYKITFKAEIPDDVWSGRSKIFLKATLRTTDGDVDSVTNYLKN